MEDICSCPSECAENGRCLDLPELKEVKMNKIKIQEAINKDKIVLFMKGTRHFPQCGFQWACCKNIRTV